MNPSYYMDLLELGNHFMFLQVHLKQSALFEGQRAAWVFALQDGNAQVIKMTRLENRFISKVNEAGANYVVLVPSGV